MAGTALLTELGAELAFGHSHIFVKGTVRKSPKYRLCAACSSWAFRPNFEASNSCLIRRWAGHL